MGYLSMLCCGEALSYACLAQHSHPFPSPMSVACLVPCLPFCARCVCQWTGKLENVTAPWHPTSACPCPSPTCTPTPCANTSAAASSVLELRHGSKEQAPHVEHCAVGSSGAHISSCSSSHYSNRPRCAWGRTWVPVPGLQQASVQLLDQTRMQLLHMPTRRHVVTGWTQGH